MIKILLADDQYLMLEGMKAILKQEPEIEVVGTAQDGRSAIAQVQKLQPDVVLIDIEMPRMNGIAATKYICKHSPNIRVIILTGHKNHKYVAEALQAGASGYVSKDSLLQDLKQAIYSWERSYSYVDTNLLTQAVKKIQKINPTNIDRYKTKIAYLKKYQKSIYNPTLKQRQKSNLFLQNSTSSGVTKANLAPIFGDRIGSKSNMHLRRRSSNIQNLNEFNRRRYLRRIVWLLMAIASFVLSVIIF